ncbi:ABC transporter ATP-binding protein [Agrococcus sp. SGAir0287]|uniref:ABC transporter ATP-binding protein n=1 Tax=Agrococcus sp. SGAir0287 TaxID=2070347 RepID=UPI0020C7910F|nr:ATP-binding cassette domain-containing protein [Agrococcus sp. SGAir0287]
MGAGDQRRPFAELTPEEQAERRREAARKAAATRARNRARQAAQAKAQAQAAAGSAPEAAPATPEPAAATPEPAADAPVDDDQDVVVEEVQSAEREAQAPTSTDDVEPEATPASIDEQDLTEEPAPEPASEPEPDGDPEPADEAQPVHEPEPEPEPVRIADPVVEGAAEEPAPEPEPAPVGIADPVVEHVADPVVERVGEEPEPESQLARPTEDEGDPDDEPVEVVGVQSAIDESPVAAPSDSTASHADARPAVVLRLEGVTRRFGTTLAVDDVLLEVRAGECHGIVGPNGAGKSTTVSIASGLMRPTTGTVQVGGRDVRARGVQSLLGVVPDRMRLFDRLTGRQLLVHAAMLRRVPRAEAITRAATLLERFELTPDADRLVSDYSIGMQQLIGIAAALIHAPRVVVLDEPFESIDPVATDTILSILADLRRRGGAVVLTSHDMALVERACDHVVVLQDGVVRASGPIDEVRDGMRLEDRFARLVGSSPHQELPWLSPSLD